MCTLLTKSQTAGAEIYKIWLKKPRELNQINQTLSHWLTDQLNGDHENGLQAELASTSFKQVLQTRAQKLHNQRIVFVTRAEIVQLRNTLCIHTTTPQHSGYLFQLSIRFCVCVCVSRYSKSHPQNNTDGGHHSFDISPCDPILLILGINVAERVSNQMVVYFPT